MKNNKIEDIILINKCLLGDQKSFTILFNKHYKNVYYLIFKLTKNNILTDEIVLESFNKAFKKINLYNSEFSFLTWMNTIAKNTLISYNRSLQKKHNITMIHYEMFNKYDSDGVLNEPMEFCDETKNQLENIISKEKVIEINRILNSIKNSKMRETFRLLIFEGRSHLEIQKKLSISLSKVKIYIFRARKFMIKELQPQLNSLRS